MLESSCFRVLKEISSRRIKPQSLQTHLRIRHLSSTSRYLVTKHDLPPPPAEHVPSAKELSKYVSKIGRSSIVRSVTEPYAAYGGTEILFAECVRQADYTVPNLLKKPSEPAPKNAAGEDIGTGTGLWFAPRSEGGLELPVTFFNWAQVMYLHLYVLTVRMRRFPPEHVRIWEQHLMDHFYYAAEDKMEKWHGMYARGTRNKYLKDLWQQWRGALISYDEGLIKGDAMLAAAVWRAIFNADINASIQDVAWVTAYLRRELQQADVVTGQDIAAGKIKFGDLKSAKQELKTRSSAMDKPFNQTELTAAQSMVEQIKK